MLVPSFGRLCLHSPSRASFTRVFVMFSFRSVAVGRPLVLVHERIIETTLFADPGESSLFLSLGYLFHDIQQLATIVRGQRAPHEGKN